MKEKLPSELDSDEENELLRELDPFNADRDEHEFEDELDAMYYFDTGDVLEMDEVEAELQALDGLAAAVDERLRLGVKCGALAREHDDAVGALDGGEAVGDGDGGAAALQPSTPSRRHSSAARPGVRWIGQEECNLCLRIVWPPCHHPP